MTSISGFRGQIEHRPIECLRLPVYTDAGEALRLERSHESGDVGFGPRIHRKSDFVPCAFGPGLDGPGNGRRRGGFYEMSAVSTHDPAGAGIK